jgi:hypothetical protein
MSDSTPATECTIPQPGPSAEHESSCGLLGVAALARPDAHANRRLTIHCGRVTLALYRRRASQEEWSGIKGWGARSIKPSEGSRSRVRRTRDAMEIQSIFV